MFQKMNGLLHAQPGFPVKCLASIEGIMRCENNIGMLHQLQGALDLLVSADAPGAQRVGKFLFMIKNIQAYPTKMILCQQAQKVCGWRLLTP